MNDDERHELLKLIEAGDRYGLMLLAVSLWLAERHPQAAHGAVYAFHADETPPVRITVPACPSSAGR